MRAVIVLALLVVAGGAGCTPLTGRPVGRWVDDKTITARVKARLTATGFASLTRIHVDTYEGRVYLTGAVTRPELKQRIEELVATVPGVDQVIANLPVAPALVSLAAAEGEPMPAALPRLDDRHPLLRRLRLGRLEVETGTPGWTQYAAYDPAGRLVATVYSTTAAEMRQQGVAGLHPGDRPIDHVSIYPRTSSAGAYYDVVLWHVSRDDMAPLQ
jgi:hypothetical protein